MFAFYLIASAEMEFLNSISSRRLEFLSGFLPSLSFLQNAIHELTRVFLFGEFFYGFFKIRVEVGFLINSASRRDCEEHEAKDSHLLSN
jgi:hypothetical protein